MAVLPNWLDLINKTDDELAALDTAVVNMACAVGLPGIERFDPARCLEKMDAWTENVRQRTRDGMKWFHESPGKYRHSEAFFRTIVLARSLSDLGLRYNQAKRALEVPLAAEDSFIHGILLGEGGTCASLPVVHVAVGRRLGYPLKLVPARSEQAGHLFFRWDGDGDRFNVDAQGTGFTSEPDDFYRTGFYAVSPEVETQLSTTALSTRY
jgi:hypothetical protein